MEIINLDYVSKRYGEFYALSNISLKISQGEFLAVTGASGSGKSTLLNLMGLIDGRSSGRIFINGQNVCLLSDSKKAAFRNKTFGFVFQSFHLEPKYTVKQNVELPLIIGGFNAQKRKLMAEAAIKKVGLTSKLNKTADTLSGGEMQRVAMARAIAGGADIILADEPCGNLDTKNSQIILDLLQELNREGKTIIMVTHNLQHAGQAKRIIDLSDGKISSDIVVCDVRVAQDDVADKAADGIQAEQDEIIDEDAVQNQTVDKIAEGEEV